MSSSDLAINVKGLSKCFHIYENPRNRLKQFILPRLQKVIGQQPKNYFNEFWALQDISFTIKKGETIGIIGQNGAGKSTLLQIICGTLSPTSGTVEVDGRVAALLELGSGFNPEFTGRENIYMSAAILGLSEQEAHQRFDDIVEFANIGDFINRPVKTYSSGMFARLAFSVAINVNPDILVVDEALSVGDIRFQQKCYRKFRELQENNKTILFVTHDLSSIINYCSYAIWIDNGKKEEEGSPEKICGNYMSVTSYGQESKKAETSLKERSYSMPSKTQWIKTEGFDSFGEKRIIIKAVALLDENNINSGSFLGGELVALKVKAHSLETINNIIGGFVAYDHLGNAIFGSNTYINNYGKLSFQANTSYMIDFSFRVPHLRNGEFTISVAIAEGSQENHIQHHWVHHPIVFNINSRHKSANAGFLLRDVGTNIKVEKLL